MKLLIASDIHGAADWCRNLMAAVDVEQPDRVVLLGDLLYHGPRNNIPADYNPQAVVAMLNSIAAQIIAVRGNCDAEVDQMLLDFPILADYTVILDELKGQDIDGSPLVHELFLTHGHVYGAGLDNSVDHLPKLPPHTTLVYGHTHIYRDEESALHPGLHIFNPGSVGIPKDGAHSFGVYESGVFRHCVMEPLS